MPACVNKETPFLCQLRRHFDLINIRDKNLIASYRKEGVSQRDKFPMSMLDEIERGKRVGEAGKGELFASA